MKRWISLVLILALGGCATAMESTVAFPLRGQSQEQMYKDMSECEAFAQEKKQDAQAAGTGAIVGALGGAAVGAVSGAIEGGIGVDTAVGAAVGALVGLFAGSAEERARYKSIYAACLNARGYSVGG